MRRFNVASAEPAAALALLLAVILGGYMSLVGPVVARHAQLAESIEAQRRLLSQYEAEIRARPLLLQSLEALRKLERERGYQIEEETGNLAALALRTLLRRSASATGEGCALQSQQDRPGGDEVARVRLRARLRCSVDGLRRLLHDLEGGRPLVLVERLQVRPRPARGARRNVAALDTTLELSARFAGTVQ